MGFRLHRPTPGASLIEGDAREALRKFSENRFDSCVTDGPYELGFMGKGWDRSGIVNDPAFWSEVLRVLKPGAHMASFGHSRTSHRMTCAIEDAGFEIRDSIDWLYGSGNPKFVDVARAVEMECCTLPGRHCDKNFPAKHRPDDHLCPSIPWVQEKFGGRDTALKPGKEPIILARKPLDGTIAQNVQQWGTVGLNIDECRVGGRWPANVILDEGAAAELDAQSGVLTSGVMKKGTKRKTRQGVAFGLMGADTTTTTTLGDSGGASRFFYVAKPSRRERDLGCGELPIRSGGEATNREDDSTGTRNARAGAGRNGGARNFHPTVKPVSLMRWLVRLVTPPGGTVLDPFTGSGTTGIAARLERRDFVGMELTPDYVPIALARIADFASYADGEIEERAA